LSVLKAIMSDEGKDFYATVLSHGSVTVVSSTAGPVVTGVTIQPNTVDVRKGSTFQFSATVAALGGAANTVNWSVNSTVSTINSAGLLSVAAGETLDTLTVTAESTFDSTKSGTALVSVKPADNTTGNPSNPGNPGVDNVDDAPLPLVSYFPFTDVNEGDWFYGDVFYMWENGLMNGMSETLFRPNSTLTRGMVVTVLYRMEKEPDITGLDNPFPDVAEGQYYTNAVKWAADKKIVLGYEDGNYQPDRNVTREEFAAILYRYEKDTDNIPPNTAGEKVFDDADSINEYAREPVNALVMQGIITGRPDNRFDPKGNATRAEFAAMLHRYIVAITVAQEE